MVKDDTERLVGPMMGVHAGDTGIGSFRDPDRPSEDGSGVQLEAPYALCHHCLLAKAEGRSRGNIKFGRHNV